MLLSLDTRAVVSVSGEDAAPFLHALLTNTMLSLSTEIPRYAALLTPQGKYTGDVFVWKTEEGCVLDVSTTKADAWVTTLRRYALRRPLAITRREDLQVAVDLSTHTDPRLPILGARAVVAIGSVPIGDPTVYLEQRVRHGVLEGEEIPEGEAWILEYGFRELHGVDFKKGCYVGQEITARMHFKSIAKKGLYCVTGTLPLPEPGSPVMSDGRRIGTLRAIHGTLGVALLHHSNANGLLRCENCPITARRALWASAPAG